MSDDYTYEDAKTACPTYDSALLEVARLRNIIKRNGAGFNEQRAELRTLRKTHKSVVIARDQLAGQVARAHREAQIKKGTSLGSVFDSFKEDFEA